jgi:hypothetical protein
MVPRRRHGTWLNSMQRHLARQCGFFDHGGIDASIMCGPVIFCDGIQTR